MNSARVLVTGAASGIGKGIVRKYLDHGTRVILLDKDEEKLNETINNFSSSFDSDFICSITCDLKDEAQIEKGVEKAWSYWGGIDILINNAGTAFREPFTDISLQHWDEIMNVNLRAIFFISQLVSKQMINHNIKGSIVNMSSKNGLSGSSKLAHYNSSKAGINLLTQSMAVELAEFDIRVNAVAPGFIKTPLDDQLKQEEDNLTITDRTPMKRLGTVNEVANGVFFLSSKEASYITGTVLVIDGGHLANASEF